MSFPGFMGAKALVMLSSGLDSTVNLYLAKKEYGSIAAITFDYGQRAAKKELARSKSIAQKTETSHQVIDLRWLGNLGKSSLTDNTQIIPQGKAVSIDDFNTSKDTAKAVWVPNRNGVFLNVAASIAEAHEIPLIIPGFNLEEANTFPDNSEEFLDKTNQTLKLSTNNRVKVECKTVGLNKTQIVALGKTLNVDFDLIWPCYFSGEQICGQCESCLRFYRALTAN